MADYIPPIGNKLKIQFNCPSGYVPPDGKLVKFVLCSDAQEISIVGYSGEEILPLELTSTPAEEFHGLCSSGEALLIDLTTAESIVLEAIAYSGDTFFADLAATGEWHITFGEGQLLELGLYKPNTFTDFKATIHQYFYFKADMNSMTDFDLTRDKACCPPAYKDPNQEDINLELDNVPLNWSYEGSDIILFTAELTTAPRFTIDFTSGEEFTLKDYRSFFEMTIFSGEGITIPLHLFADIPVILCPGNFIPDGDSVDIELSTEYNENCYADYLYGGEEFLKMEMSTTSALQSENYCGEAVIANLTTTEPWRVTFLNGEEGVLYNPEMYILFSSGESCSTAFYVEPINAYGGEEFLASMSIIYDVEFAEDGCFENEYIPSDENGDPIWEMMQPVPIELDYFQHDIKARCLK